MTTHGVRHPEAAVLHREVFITDLTTRAEVSVVSFSATSPSASHSEVRFFARAAQAEATATLATYFGWHRVMPI